MDEIVDAVAALVEGQFPLLDPPVGYAGALGEVAHLSPAARPAPLGAAAGS